MTYQQIQTQQKENQSQNDFISFEWSKNVSELCMYYTDGTHEGHVSHDEEVPEDIIISLNSLDQDSKELEAIISKYAQNFEPDYWERIEH